MNNYVYLKIENCQQCPNVSIDRQWTSDSFETCFIWKCKKNEMKIIAEYVDWNDKILPPIPNWCPLRTKKKEKI